MALDLKKYKYSLTELKINIYAICLLEIIQTQIIDEEFAVNYILNKLFQLTDLEENITLRDVLHNQPHLNIEKIMKLYAQGPASNLIPNFDDYA